MPAIKRQTTVENQLIADRAAYPQKKAEYEKAYHQYMQNVPMHTLLDRSQAYREFYCKKIDPAVSCKRRASGGADTKFFELFPKHHVERITLDDNATAFFCGKRMARNDFDKSAGESQIFAAALILALSIFWLECSYGRGYARLVVWTACIVKDAAVSGRNGPSGDFVEPG